jgi:short chain dehydrogenase
MAALRRMLPQDEGTIIQIGSALAYRSLPLQSAYCAAKAAIRGFTDSLRTELIHDGSRVKLSMLQLPAVNTPQSTRQRNKLDKQSQPMPPMFTPESIAEIVLWAAEHTPREMLIGRPTVQAVWAQKFIPGLLDLYLGKEGYQPQMVDKPNEQKGDILFETLPGDPGAHGPYRDKERRPDLQMRLRTHLPAVGLAALGTLALIGGGNRGRRQGR